MSSNNNTLTLTDALACMNELRVTFNEPQLVADMHDHYTNHADEKIQSNYLRDILDAKWGDHNRENYATKDWQGDKFVAPTFARLVWCINADDAQHQESNVSEVCKNFIPGHVEWFRNSIDNIQIERVAECMEIIQKAIVETRTALKPLKGLEKAVKYMSEAKRRRVYHLHLADFIKAVEGHITAMQNVRTGYAAEGRDGKFAIMTVESAKRAFRFRIADTDGLKWEVARDLEALMDTVITMAQEVVGLMPEPTTFENDVKELNSLRPAVPYIYGIGNATNVVREALKLTQAPKVTVDNVLTMKGADDRAMGRKTTLQMLKAFEVTDAKVKDEINTYFKRLKKWEDKRAAIIAAQG